MGIESNKEAYKTMQNAIGSLENRFREVYNKGYHDGLKEGINQATQKLVIKLLDEVEADTSQTEAVVMPYKPTNRQILDAIENCDCPWK